MNERRPSLLTAIALGKLFKALVLAGAGIVALHLSGRGGAGDTWLQVVHVLRIDPNNRIVHATLSRLIGLDAHTLEKIGVGTFLYAGLYTVEGIGLLQNKRWAEYLTVISTAGFLPLEIYEITKHPHVLRVALLVVNLLIVVYLFACLRKKSPVQTMEPVSVSKRTDNR